MAKLEVQGVALIVHNKEGKILILKEFNSKPDIGKFFGMFGIPMETIKEGETEESALARLIEEELPGFGSSIELKAGRVGVYHINHARAFLYVGSVPNCTLPLEKAGNDVGDYRWVHPMTALGLWPRQGAEEMIIDYTNKVSGVTRHCRPVSSRRPA